jgi:hypothetical protein
MLSFKDFFKEETISGDVRGLGYVTGDPSAPVDGVSQYVTTNQLASDKVNGAMLKVMKDFHHHDRDDIGIKAHNPTDMNNKKTKGKK